MYKISDICNQTFTLVSFNVSLVIYSYYVNSGMMVILLISDLEIDRTCS